MAVSRYYKATTIKTYLDSAISDSSVEVTTTTDPQFPTSYPFTIIVDRDTASEEVMEVTALLGVAGSKYTYAVTRGTSVEPTMSVVAHNAGATIEHGVSARDFRESRQHESDTNGVHGVVGNVVGTTDAQALQFKTLDATNSVSQSAVAGLSTTLNAKANTASPTFTGTVTASGATSVALPAATTIGSVSPEEIARLDGVTSGIQSQLDGKVSASGATFTGSVVIPTLTVNTSATLPASTSIGNVSSTELGYLDGVTSSIQTQINNLSTSGTGVQKPASAGMLAVTNASTGASTARTITGDTAKKISVTNGDGISGNPTVTTTGVIPTSLQAGSVNVNMGGNATSESSVTFATPFAVQPIVVGTANDGLYNIAITAFTTNAGGQYTGMTVRSRNINNATSTDVVAVRWVAVQI